MSALACCLASAFPIHESAARTALSSIQVELTLDQCIARAVEQNLSVQVQQLDWDIAKWGLVREWSVFEPALTASAQREENNRRNTVEESLSQLNPTFEEKNDRFDVGMEGLFFSGARYRVGYNLNDLANNLTNQTFQAGTNETSQSEFESEYRSFAGGNITQPLLKNAGLKATMAAIRLAAAGSDIALENFRKQLMEIVAGAEAAYWDLAVAQAVYHSRRESTEIAREILEDNEKRVEAGKMSKLEVFQAKAGLATRLIREEEARNNLIEAMDHLRTFLSETSGEEDVWIVATDQPVIRDVDPDFSESMSRATDWHPDYLRNLKEVEQEGIRLAYAKNQRWPQLDLVGSYGYNGLGDSVGDSWDEVNEGNFESWAVGVEMRVSLGGGRESRSQLQIAHRRKRKAVLGLKATEVTIANTLHAAINRVRSFGKSIENYEVMELFIQRLLDVELSRLDAGKSDSRKVLEVEEDLFEAKTDRITSAIDYQKALVTWDLAQGALLRSWDLDLLDDSRDIEDDYKSLRKIKRSQPWWKPSLFEESPSDTSKPMLTPRGPEWLEVDADQKDALIEVKQAEGDLDRPVPLHSPPAKRGSSPPPKIPTGREGPGAGDGDSPPFVSPDEQTMDDLDLPVPRR